MRRVGWILLAALVIGAGAQAQQPYPNHPIKLIVPFAAGGNTDVMGRIVAAKLSETLGQQMVVENRTGAGTVVGTDMVAKAPADGYTLLFTTVAHAVNPGLYKKLPFDPVADFQPVALVAQVPLVIVVNPTLPVTDLKGLIALLKANPGKYSYGSAGNGSALHLGPELFKAVAGVDIVHVPYRGAAPALNDLLSGQLAMMTDAVSTSAQYVRAGTLRALAVTTPQRASILPEVPTAAEAGLRGYEAYTWVAFFAPAGTPRPIVDRLVQDAHKAVAEPAVRQRLVELGGEIVTDSTPESLAVFLRAEMAKWIPLVEASGAKVD
jgi:tripartite-type tricarboxylate transporter receptor subunit TctC